MQTKTTGKIRNLFQKNWGFIECWVLKAKRRINKRQLSCFINDALSIVQFSLDSQEVQDGSAVMRKRITRVEQHADVRSWVTVERSCVTSNNLKRQIKLIYVWVINKPVSLITPDMSPWEWGKLGVMKRVTIKHVHFMMFKREREVCCGIL